MGACGGGNMGTVEARGSGREVVQSEKTNT